MLLVGLAVIGGVAFNYIVKSRRHASKLTCVENLKFIGVCERGYAEDHNGNFPWMLSTTLGGSLEYCGMGGQTFRHFQVQSNYIQMRDGIICPQDARRAAMSWVDLANTNVSYFVGLDSKPDLRMSIVAGDRNITPDSSVTLQANQSTPPSWVKSVGLHADRGHLAFSDGHVEELDSVGLASAIQQTGILTNHFAVP